MSIRIMATADVHLGMKFSRYDSCQAELVEARFTALQRAVEAANERDCQLFLVAGDLFHKLNVAARVVERGAEILSKFAGRLCAVLPGNHDFVSAGDDSLWQRFGNAAGDSVIVLDAARAYDLDLYDLNVDILAGPCDSVHGSDHRLTWLRSYDRRPGRPVVGLAHGSVDGLTLDNEGRYFPMSREFLAGEAADVWIVGHTHRQHDLSESRLVIPGTPEPDGFDCAGHGAAAFIELTDEGYSVEPVQTGTFRFVRRTIDIASDGRFPDDVVGDEPETTLLRLTLQGAVSTEQRNSIRGQLSDLEERLPFFDVDESRLRKVLNRREVDNVYAEGSFAHAVLTELLDGDDEAGAAAASDILDTIDSAGGAT